MYFPPECPAVANVLAVLVQATIETGILMVVLILLASPGERRLVLGPSDTAGLTPLTDEERARAAAMRWPTDDRIPA